MTYFDDKQKKLINSWRNLSLESKDAYMAFMAEWIAFNAICYHLYFKKAIIERANIDRSKSKLNEIHELLNHRGEVVAENAKISVKSERWNIDLSLPDRLFISVSNNYTEDIIFNEFVKDNEKWYSDKPSNSFEELKKSLSKDNRHYVINMAKSNNYSENHDINEMANKNTIILCEKNNLRIIKNVLYQIRCNIFHGEKTPGDVNDDRIVKSALPVLKYIVDYLVEAHKINTNAL